jgi:AraC family ethanolamine operon transcriptional activator
MRSQVFRDFDAFAESVRDVDSRMTLRNPKRRIWSTSSVDLDGIDVQLGRLGSGNIAQGQLRADGYMLYLPLTDGVEYLANGSLLEKSAFAILEPGCEFCISTKVEHDWCVAFVPTHMFARGVDLVESPSNSEKTTCRVTRANHHIADQFRAIVLQIMTTAAECFRFESSPAASCAAAELLEVASVVVGRQQAVEPNREGRPKAPRQEIIRRSMELLEQRVGEPVRVGEFAAAADVSERTLRTAFNEYFGVGPVRYLQLRQLHQVYRVLRAADPKDLTVSEVLVEHGEWAFSRFALRYRQLFGELPSETLRRKRPR